MAKNKGSQDVAQDALRESRNIEVIKNRYCDEPMAKRMHLLPCNKNCRECLACIEITSTGEKRHFSPMRTRKSL